MGRNRIHSYFKYLKNIYKQVLTFIQAEKFTLYFYLSTFLCIILILTFVETFTSSTDQNIWSEWCWEIILSLLSFGWTSTWMPSFTHARLCPHANAAHKHTSSVEGAGCESGRGWKETQHTHTFLNMLSLHMYWVGIRVYPGLFMQLQTSRREVKWQSSSGAWVHSDASCRPRAFARACDWFHLSESSPREFHSQRLGSSILISPITY